MTTAIRPELFRALLRRHAAGVVVITAGSLTAKPPRLRTRAFGARASPRIRSRTR